MRVGIFRVISGLRCSEVKRACRDDCAAICSGTEDPVIDVLVTSRIPMDAKDVLFIAVASVLASAIEEVANVFVGLKWPCCATSRGKVVASYSIHFEDLDDLSRFYLELRVNTNGVREGRELSETSLSAEAGAPVSNEALLRSLLKRLSNALSDIKAGVRARFILEFTKHFANLGEEVKVVLTSGEEVVGEVMGLGRDGSIALLSAGKMVFIKPSEARDVVTLWP